MRPDRVALRVDSSASRLLATGDVVAGAAAVGDVKAAVQKKRRKGARGETAASRSRAATPNTDTTRRWPLCTGREYLPPLVIQLSSGILVHVSQTLSIPHPLPDALVELIAQRFRVVGEPMRIRLLDALRDGPLSINELTEALGASQQNVSKHVGVLAQAGIVAREKDGNRVRCYIADDTIFELCELVCGGLHKHVAELDRLLGGRAPVSAS